jgi:putative sigma-54 modulation protein
MEYEMQINVSSKHMTITPSIESYAIKKVDKLQRFFDRIQQIDVVIDKAKNGYTTEIITNVEHHEPFIARSDHDDLYACLDLGVNRAARQLKDHKSRLRDNKHHAPTNGLNGIPGTPSLRSIPGLDETSGLSGRHV